ncbi:NmrA family NAD(P)-binding protein [Paenibacillus glycinis]|uniref:NmrA family NAD(P)-binding protein n=1 Tax=Paenibacillus glycinis TaxID=2697035 RepID=A0ABW9XYE3_9BACL|nr:NmrA family NAD(P)-binding protein [Paenibacillus glycinis]NBD27737.1 NmrA family NAD(P)-binding protein [Paenibacillus glycinis]
MYAIMGVTGQVGGAAAKKLLAAGKAVRAIVRDERKAEAWRALGAEAAIADYLDSAALEAAFAGAEGVFVMIPPTFYPKDGFPEARAFVKAVGTALEKAAVPKFAALSSVGAHRSEGLGIIESLHILETELGRLAIPSVFLRAAWFMENALWDIEPARADGRVPHFLSPLDRKIPMISTADVGAIAADALQQTWSGTRCLELLGPESYSPADIAAVLAKLIGRPAEAISVPRADWADAFIRQGGPADRVNGRLAMLDGFNAGWIDFEYRGTEIVRGTIALEEALAKLL